MNSASVRIGLSTGLDAIIKTAHTLGIETELDEVPSLILGSVAITPIEMASAYTTIARVGGRVPLHSVRFVLDDRGGLVAGAGEVKPVQVFPARDVYLGIDVMKGVIDHGTAAGARSLGFRKIAAGKTGTTNDKRDAWFIGFTPRTLALTWIGFDDNSPVGVSGGEGAVPIWTRFMSDITSGAPDSDFPIPPGISFAEIDTTSGGLATLQCPSNMVEKQAFKDGTAPTVPCLLHNPPVPLLPPLGMTPFPEGTATDTTGTPGLQPPAGGFPTQTLGGGIPSTDTAATTGTVEQIPSPP